MRHRKPPKVLKHGCSVRRVAEEAGNFGFVGDVGDGEIQWNPVNQVGSIKQKKEWSFMFLASKHIRNSTCGEQWEQIVFFANGSIPGTLQRVADGSWRVSIRKILLIWKCCNRPDASRFVWDDLFAVYCLPLQKIPWNCHLMQFWNVFFLGCGFKYPLCSTLLGEMIQFDKYFSTGLKPPTSFIYFTFSHHLLLI